MAINKDANQMTFWEHLEELRSLVLKAIALTVVFSIVAFLLKDELFQIENLSIRTKIVVQRILERGWLKDFYAAFNIYGG